MSAAGRLTKDELSTVQAGIQLRKDAAAKWRRFVKVVKRDFGVTIRIAGPAGGYRSSAMQRAMHIAGSVHGTAAARTAWGLNPRSTVAIADDPYGTHQDGTCVDIVGIPMTAKFVKYAADHDVVRPFGPRDPNHFKLVD